jgi:hypothetical protein
MRSSLVFLMACNAGSTNGPDTDPPSEPSGPAVFRPEGFGWSTRARFSPDGTRIAAIATLDGPSGDNFLVTFDVDGSNTLEHGAASFQSPLVWTPDGQHLVFQPDEFGALMHQIPVEGGTAVPWVTNCQDGTIAPDGQRYVCEYVDELVTGDLPPQGNAPGSDLEGWRPRYSPDGSQVAYIGYDGAYWATLQWVDSSLQGAPEGVTLDVAWSQSDEVAWLGPNELATTIGSDLVRLVPGEEPSAVTLDPAPGILSSLDVHLETGRLLYLSGTGELVVAPLP